MKKNLFLLPVALVGAFLTAIAIFIDFLFPAKKGTVIHLKGRA